MELDPQDNGVVKLLTKLKHEDFAYPPGLLASRRQKYIRRVAEVGAGFGVAVGLKSRNGKNGSITPTTGNLLEIALVAVILVEAGSAAYFYRDKISKYFESYSSKVQVLEVTSTPEFSSPLPEMTLTEIPEIVGTPNATETQTEIPIPSGVADKDDEDDQQTNSTPDPNGDNGNHFGQTPKPDRTRDPGDNNNDEHAKEQTEGHGGSMDN
jgi:hypothetical protein